MLNSFSHLILTKPHPFIHQFPKYVSPGTVLGETAKPLPHRADTLEAEMEPKQGNKNISEHEENYEEMKQSRRARRDGERSSCFRSGGRRSL